MRTEEDLFSLRDRVAVVTGASGHLGTSIARGLARAGASVVLNGRSTETLGALAGRLRAEGLRAEASVFDVRDADAVHDAFSQIVTRHGRVDVLVNNAYTGGSGGGTLPDEDVFEEGLRSGLTSVYGCVRAAEAGLRAAAATQGTACVINIASMYAHISPDPRRYGDESQANPAYYGTAKAGVVQLTRYLACHLGPFGIRVNSVSPGPFPSDDVTRGNEKFTSTLADRVPLGRVGRRDEIVGPILFLSSDAASYVNGADLRVDGGWTAW